MKKIVLILLVVMMTCAAAACAPQAEPAPTAEPTPGASASPAAPEPTAVPKPTETPTPAEQTPEVPEPTDPPELGLVSVSLELVDAYPNLTFNKPLYFTSAGDGTQECYVVQQTGQILVFEDDSQTAQAETFLDISDIVNTRGNEEGLLGLAFHPDYAQNGYFYVNYTSNTGTVIARYTRSADNRLQADPDSVQVVLTFDQPYANHNGGHLAFGPDGYLYIATGDGGSGGDPDNRSQDLTKLLGKILRIDVDNPDAGMRYGIPQDNPFAGNELGYAPEIFAFGLRNPWRFSFDPDGRLWVADVGQNKFEEIDIVVGGGNYGWSVLEATHEFKPDTGADQTLMIAPIWEYAHDASDCITGGYVYFGDAIADLQRRYIYGDFGSGKIWALWLDEDGAAVNQELADTDYMIASFGLNADGELRVVDLMGRIYRFEVSEE